MKDLNAQIRAIVSVHGMADVLEALVNVAVDNAKFDPAEARRVKKMQGIGELKSAAIAWADAEATPEGPVFMGFTRDELTKAFHSVADKDDWRAAILARVEESKIEAVKAAIIFFTGTDPKIDLPSDGTMEVTYRVMSEGYRNGPCGP